MNEDECQPVCETQETRPTTVYSRPLGEKRGDPVAVLRYEDGGRSLELIGGRNAGGDRPGIGLEPSHVRELVGLLGVGPCSAECEIQKLAAYLMQYWPAHITEGSAVDVAIRILQSFDANAPA